MDPWSWTRTFGLGVSILTMRPSCLPTERIKALLKWKKKEWNNIVESPYWDLFKNTEIFPLISLHPLNWNYISVLFCLFYVKKLITRLLIAGNVKPGHPGRYHFSQGTVIQRVFQVSVGDKKFVSYFLRIPQGLILTLFHCLTQKEISPFILHTKWLHSRHPSLENKAEEM